MSSAQKMSVEQVRAVLVEVLNALESPEYAPKLEEAKEAAGNEMLKMMQIVFPMVLQTQMEVLKRAGLGEGRNALVQWSRALRAAETADGETARLHNQLRAHYMPPVCVSSATENSL